MVNVKETATTKIPILVTHIHVSEMVLTLYGMEDYDQTMCGRISHTATCENYPCVIKLSDTAHTRGKCVCKTWSSQDQCFLRDKECCIIYCDAKRIVHIFNQWLKLNHLLTRHGLMTQMLSEWAPMWVPLPCSQATSCNFQATIMNQTGFYNSDYLEHCKSHTPLGQ